ncbi:FadR family transcriptional regulator (plasmid) [Deinococcus metallilatus]|uniref:DNA-binding FadR family transcriptional regulator n=1 Tax=Deinococcus metallilatus TaxID=1211322 RepID=A0ABR6MYE2_9DEIO|nr:FadR/GntR family transcriptional regulator [Deinococcus metallilatus]MBB5296957.1 DNA-binding FadR family transcriptional regulator [Deinococcus metallilatus]QBY06675.1 FadR family transcriptional regulator [Deinococcus metallilatus]GMA15144.1 GntR family transcriptional regulator [Deinococcus metallilatus]
MTARVPAYRQAQVAIKRYIEDHGLKPGDLLPPEAQLARDMGMSRLSLREGVKSLEALGILEAKQGEGIYVKAFTFDSIFENLPYSFATDGKSLRDLLQVRTALEEGLIGMVAGRATPEQLDHLERLARQMLQKAQAGETFEDEDREFHLALYEPLQNLFLNRLVELFWEVFRRLHGSANVTAWHLEQTAHDHLAILNALRARDHQRITEAMHAHFQQIHARLGPQPGTPPPVTDILPPPPANP